VDYLRDVKPVFAKRCYACHGALKQKAELRTDTASITRAASTAPPHSGRPMPACLSKISAVDESNGRRGRTAIGADYGHPSLDRALAQRRLRTNSPKWTRTSIALTTGEKDPPRPIAGLEGDQLARSNPIDAFLGPGGVSRN
jgi:hypothetical protein